MATLTDINEALQNSGATAHVDRFDKIMAHNQAIGRITFYGPNTSMKGEKRAYCEEYLYADDTVTSHALDGAKSWASHAREAVKYWQDQE